jgi:hypothetical protein
MKVLIFGRKFSSSPVRRLRFSMSLATSVGPRICRKSKPIVKELILLLFTSNGAF